ncbi:hypothetical protein HUN01_15065 [Nostoc edaphicum CCNP1411]|uniref:Uncharacterized protein n=1 Tax=Nostoc edaphicum CCNP1411 TaxID=1472755 RepID=A0A7D7LAV4_9NOSO|nr:hypothetical protein [Nostoc edaphicum]QMS88856.1 hypothetical protein HUN01_15065 [Nostoc edaphicum CCNP1411]
MVDVHAVAIAPAKSCGQFGVRMLLLSDFLGTIGLSDEKIVSQSVKKMEMT